jgi:hypothetical protein
MKSIENLFEPLSSKPVTGPTGTSNGSFGAWIASKMVFYIKLNPMVIT